MVNDNYLILFESFYSLNKFIASPINQLLRINNFWKSYFLRKMYDFSFTDTECEMPPICIFMIISEKHHIKFLIIMNFFSIFCIWPKFSRPKYWWVKRKISEQCICINQTIRTLWKIYKIMGGIIWIYIRIIRNSQKMLWNLSHNYWEAWLLWGKN